MLDPFGKILSCTPDWTARNRVIAVAIGSRDSSLAPPDVIQQAAPNRAHRVLQPIPLCGQHVQQLAAARHQRVQLLDHRVGEGARRRAHALSKELAAAILVGIGIIGPGDFLQHAVPTHWPAYVFPTMFLVSLGISYYLTMGDELMDTTLALRTKERDEAMARQQAAEARLAALEARVQPHFLFNALNSIAALIPDDADGAERMVERVAALMRSSLQHDRPSTAPLQGELRLVCDYLEIERVRFRDRLRYELRIAAGMDHVPVPRLSIQTLVENAVKYAVARQRSGATIVIAASTQEDRALITVSDDGPGFAALVEGEGQGLRLLRARLETLFGGRAALRIDSRPGATSCVMEIPIR